MVMVLEEGYTVMVLEEQVMDTVMVLEEEAMVLEEQVMDM